MTWLLGIGKFFSNHYVVVLGLLLLVAATVGGLIAYCDNREDTVTKQIKQQGAVEERVKHQEEVINAVREANRPVTRNDIERVRSKYDRDRN